MNPPKSVPISVLVLLAIAGGLIAAAVIEIGPRTASARTETQLITAERGVVQSTVTGTGNVEPGVEDTVNFKTSGILQDVFVHVGQHVTEGQLMATLDPSAAKLALAQAKENLTAAEDQLTSAKDASYTQSAAQASADSTEFVDYHPSTTGTDEAADDTSTGSQATPTVTQTVTVTTPAPTPPTVTRTVTVTSPTKSPTRVPTPTHTVTVTTPTSTPTTTTPTRTVTVTTPSTTSTPSSGSSTYGSGTTGTSGTSGYGTGSTGSGSGRSGTSGFGGSGSGSSSNSSNSSSGSSTTDKAASIAQAQASVDSARAAVTTAQQNLDDTNLYAPATGTIVSLQAVSAGDSITAGGTGNANSSSSSSSTGSSSSGAAGALGSFLGSSTSSSSDSSSSSSGFAEIVNSKQLTMTVPFSESDITKIKVGQPATVTLDALAGVELGAHVSSISTIGSTSSSVVSYNATITLDQTNAQVRPGMSASVAVIIGEAQGVTLPNNAVNGTGSLGTVQLMKDGKPVSQQVVVGLRGDSRTEIISGLSAGQEVSVTTTLPALGQSSASSSKASTGGTLGSGRFGGGGLGGAGGGGFGGAGGGGLFRRALGG